MANREYLWERRVSHDSKWSYDLHLIVKTVAKVKILIVDIIYEKWLREAFSTLNVLYLTQTKPLYSSSLAVINKPEYENLRINSHLNTLGFVDERRKFSNVVIN